jgi:hypothetical protein
MAASCTMGTGSFPGVKAAGRDADHTPPSRAEVKKELNYTSTHPMGPPGPVMGFPLPLLGIWQPPVQWVPGPFRG